MPLPDFGHAERFPVDKLGCEFVHSVIPGFISAFSHTKWQVVHSFYIQGYYNQLKNKCVHQRTSLTVGLRIPWYIFMWEANYVPKPLLLSVSVNLLVTEYRRCRTWWELKESTYSCLSHWGRILYYWNLPDSLLSHLL